MKKVIPIAVIDFILHKVFKQSNNLPLQSQILCRMETYNLIELILNSAVALFSQNGSKCFWYPVAL